MKHTTTHRPWQLALLLVAALALAACGGEANATEEPSDTQIFSDFVPVVSATGKVVPEQWATLSVQSGGIVEELLVSEDDAVTEGQTLLRLSGAARLEAAVAGAQLELTSAQQAYDALFEFQDTNKALAELAVAIQRDAARDAQIRLNNVTIPTSQDDIDAAFARLVLAEDTLDQLRTAWDNVKNKPESNVQRAQTLTALNAAQDAYDSALRSYNYATGTGDEIDEAKAAADLKVAEAQLADAERALEDMADGPDADDLALAEARLANAEAQAKAAQEALDDLILTAPFDGTISQLSVRENEWVSPGQPLVVIGNLSRLQIETTDLNEIDVARIDIGSVASITFDALPDVVVEATVVRIATKASPGAGVNYTVILELNEVPEKLLWDMTAFVDIEIE